MRNYSIIGLDSTVNSREVSGRTYCTVLDNKHNLLWKRRAKEEAILNLVIEVKRYIMSEEEKMRENLEPKESSAYLLSFISSGYFLYTDRCLKRGVERPSIQDFKNFLDRNKPEFRS